MNDANGVLALVDWLGTPYPFAGLCFMFVVLIVWGLPRLERGSMRKRRRRRK